MTKSNVPTLQDRASGLLMHISSLPTPFAIGDLGPAAYSFADALSDSRQRWWQVLPVGPIGAGNSPYQSFSSFAGNSLLISPELLAKDGLLEEKELFEWRHPASDEVDFEHAKESKKKALWTAFARFEKASAAQRHAFQQFCRSEAKWLDDYALFSALRFHFDGKEWMQWDTPLRDRQAAALRKARRELAQDMRYHQFVQWLFVSQWRHLHDYCRDRGIGIIGDVPIFVSPNSADVWANPRLFKLRADGTPDVVAGVPPDYFSRTGQRWGNPHYRWDVLKQQGYRWWIDRLRQTFNYFDAVRIDHFIGFVRYYEIPGDAETAEKGQYKAGPGASFFKTVFRKLKNAQFIAEDLGTVTPEVKALRDDFQLPGMKVLQFAFGNDPEALHYQPHNFPRNAVVYTGTHDNDTTVGWFNDVGSTSSTRNRDDIEKERRFTLEYLRSTGKEIHWDMIWAAQQSPANVAIIPMQDVLGLDSRARMNRPGTPEGNWSWRMRPNAFTPQTRDKLRKLTETYGRV